MISALKTRAVAWRHDQCSGSTDRWPVLTVDQIEELDTHARAGTQRRQLDLPAPTRIAWDAIAKAFPELDSLGAWGDRSHQSRKSCHNYNTGVPRVVGPLAIDCMTDDAALQARVVAWALKNRNVYGFSLIISRRKKWSAATKWVAKRYTGTSPHTDHVHLGLKPC